VLKLRRPETRSSKGNFQKYKIIKPDKVRGARCEIFCRYLKCIYLPNSESVCISYLPNPHDNSCDLKVYGKDMEVVAMADGSVVRGGSMVVDK
jgi:hypothetical protein